MRARFILGPAGTGKTFLCLEEIRRALASSPDGPPLILLAPKQATFQLERQLLADGGVAGFTRLRIFSFERLARFILDELRRPPPPLLSEDGRRMALHALLARRRDALEIFHASAGLAGFAGQLSAELRELQRCQLGPAALRDLAGRPGLSDSVRRKLRDLALLLTDYLAWLDQRQLQDGERLPDVAAAALAPDAKPFSAPAELWLDGFAEMTPQELALLAAIAPFCSKMTLAFCLDEAGRDSDQGWLSIWSGIRRTWRQCRERLSAVPGVELSEDVLPRDNPRGRFAVSPMLRHIEEYWPEPKRFSAEAGSAVRVVCCETPGAEAEFAAREILGFVRGGGRYRETAVMVRRMEGYHDELRRVFARHGIPFFLDRRRQVAHHPLAELTRSSLRAVAHGWKLEDWFSALKSGLICENDSAVDKVENEALERGWEGEAWFAPFRAGGEKAHWAETARAEWIGPFVRFKRALLAGGVPPPNGKQIAEALRRLWSDLGVEEKLQEWNDPVHATIWQQMNGWLDDVELAFASDAMALGEWIPVLEAGLRGLSVGVIPPALDQVLIGAVDRSRNPELKLALALSVNEKVFPAAPSSGTLLTESDREELRQFGPRLGFDTREFLAREQFFGYIACTRSSERLTVTFARRDAEGQPLNPSLFVSRLSALFPKLAVENFVVPEAKLAAPAIEAGAEKLAPELAAQLYGPVLSTSVSRIEQFAQCAFKFFVHSGLGAEERKVFELDVKERGSFQHEALAEFHRELHKEGQRWRDITPAGARARMKRIVAEIAPNFRDGLMNSSAQLRFSARSLSGALEDFVAAMVQWMSQYEFDPVAAEMGFGTRDAKLPAWELDLGSGRKLVFRGIIDRIDLARSTHKGNAWAVVVDYKSGARKLEKILMAHGLQLQLAAYLSVLRHLPDPEKIFGATRLFPAGVFYVNLRGKVEAGRNRNTVLAERDNAGQMRYQHSGRFDFEALKKLDNRGQPSGTQFKYRLKKDGAPMAGNSDLMASEQFSQLLDNVEAQLLRMGRAIYEGQIELNPYQKGSDRACEKCEYGAICRFDSWTKPFRILTDDVKLS